VDLKAPANLGALSAAILGSHLTPTALEFETHPLRLLLRFESIAAAVEQQAGNASTLIGSLGFTARSVSGPEEDEIWRQHEQPVWTGSGAVVKVSLLPTHLAAMVETRAGLGVFLVKIENDTDAQARAIDGIRSRLPVGSGSAVIVRGSSELRARTDVWGPIGDGLPLMRAVKQQFDPVGILNPGRGPGGV
jgi:glycolate oxidase FAD binding subunit